MLVGIRPFLYRLSLVPTPAPQSPGSQEKTVCFLSGETIKLVASSQILKVETSPSGENAAEVWELVLTASFGFISDPNCVQIKT